MYTTSTVAREVKRLAKENVFTPASSIVENVLAEHIDLRAPTPSLPSVACLARTANRYRERQRPADPKDLEFEISHEHMPENFLQHDVRVGENRHLIFYTDRQLGLLQKSKTWYMDATFKVVDAPFTHSIHAFVKSGSSMKQVPLVFVLMSRRRRRDYKKVFKCLLDSMDSPLALKSAVADFEAGMWTGFAGVFPDIRIRGCSFHWGQAVFRKIKSLGLEPAYHRQDATQKLLRRILCLPYLPASHILPSFQELRTFATTPALVELMDYVDNTWMSSSVWRVADWSVFGRAIRTNNDVEGWHTRLNLMSTRPNLQFYLLVPLLYTEASRIHAGETGFRRKT